jgi:imidazolonepropionase-like amidohydrolase
MTLRSVWSAWTVSHLWVLGLACSCAGSSSSSSSAAPAGPAGPPAPAAAAAPAIAVLPGDLAITNATVVPMSGDGELAHHTVVIRGDRIVAVAPSASIAIPEGATAIDGTGKWLMPGLTDMHVHLFGPDHLAMFVAAGVTLVRNMYGGEQHLAWRDKVSKGELFGPTIVTAGPIIDGDPPIWQGSTVLVNPADAERVVTEQKAAGYDFLKPYARLTRPAYEALAAAGKRHGMLLEGHVPDAVGLAGVLAAGQRTIEHLDGYLAAMVADGVELPQARPAKLRATLEHLDRARLPGLVAQTLAAGTWNCPTLVVYDRIAALDDLPALARRVAWLDELPPALVAAWDPKQDFRLLSYTAADYAAMRAANAERAKLLAALDAAHAPLLVGTDTGNPYVVPGASLHDEIELMIAAGLSRPRVLRAATADAAQFLGTPRAFGVVEPGARADLLVVSVDPLTAPLPVVPDGVVLRGAWQPRAVLEAKLGDIAHRAAAPPSKDRWEGVAPLAPEGSSVRQLRYELRAGDQSIGEDRVAIGMASGKRIIVGQEVAEFGGGKFVTSYRIAPGELSVGMVGPSQQVQLTGKVAGGKLVATGTGAGGKPLALSEPVPAGALLSGPGIGGLVALAAQLGPLAPGARRSFVALTFNVFPSAGIGTEHYDVERKPDAGGHRVYAITAATGGIKTSGDLEVDGDGMIVSQHLGPPLNVAFSRLR